ncbi:MAG: MBL fold metallo-hydrolase, partial [Planctomycetaceae bacterium]|nr:MBL fold metallo-hydrolase [Planctomycetaceae bacterium]
SNGNCIFVESGGVRLLIDAGLSGEAAANRLEVFGIDIGSSDGVLISHDHLDHVKCAGVLHRKFQLPIWITQKTYERATKQHRLGRFGDLNFFKSGERINFGKVSVETLPTVHDAVDGVCFVVDDGLRRLGVMTDLGRTKSLASVLQKNNSNLNNTPKHEKKISDLHVPRQKFFSNFGEQHFSTHTRNNSKNCDADHYERIISTLDGLLIESNFDIEMLSNGSYSQGLQERIRGRGGHLSNLEAAKLIKSAGKKLRWVCLGHISKENNTHEAVLDTHRTILGKNLPLKIASRYNTSELLEL